MTCQKQVSAHVRASSHMVDAERLQKTDQMQRSVFLKNNDWKNWVRVAKLTTNYFVGHLKGVDGAFLSTSDM